MIVIFLACYAYVYRHKWFVFPIVSTLTFGSIIGIVFAVVYFRSIDVAGSATAYQLKYMLYVYFIYMIIYLLYALSTSYTIHRIVNKNKEANINQ